MQRLLSNHTFPHSVILHALEWHGLLACPCSCKGSTYDCGCRECRLTRLGFDGPSTLSCSPHELNCLLRAMHNRGVQLAQARGVGSGTWGGSRVGCLGTGVCHHCIHTTGEPLTVCCAFGPTCDECDPILETKQGVQVLVHLLI